MSRSSKASRPGVGLSTILDGSTSMALSLTKTTPGSFFPISSLKPTRGGTTKRERKYRQHHKQHNQQTPTHLGAKIKMRTTWRNTASHSKPCRFCFRESREKVLELGLCCGMAGFTEGNLWRK